MPLDPADTRIINGNHENSVITPSLTLYLFDIHLIGDEPRQRAARRLRGCHTASKICLATSGDLPNAPAITGLDRSGVVASRRS